MKPTATKSEFGKPKVNPDYTLTRPKRLRKFEKVDGVKIQAAAWQEPEPIAPTRYVRKRIQGRKNGVNSRGIVTT